MLALLFILLFFSIGQPFGTLNDICNALAAVLALVLACLLFVSHRPQSSPVSLIALLFAFAGLVLVGVGTYLVLSAKTSWFLAGLYVTAGYALIGLWLVVLNGTALQGNPWTHGVAVLGLVAGAFMLLGLAVFPGIFSGVDSMASASWLVNYVGLPGWLGAFLLFPTWNILLGRFLLK